jgi:F0F1-type ATP synthase membrane subunit c/vacuolar-type H+-ATPase subunit K
MNNRTAELDQKYRTLAVVWFILLFSQLLFVAVVYSMRGELFMIDTSRPALGDYPPVIIGAAILALTNLAISFIMRKKAIEQGIADQKVSYIQTALVLGCAFCEAISLIGLVLALAFSYQYFFVWFAVGFIGIFLHFPRRQHLLDASYKITS